MFESHLTPTPSHPPRGHLPHDHVLRENERKRGAFAATCAYLAGIPVRAGLAATAGDWSFTGSIIPGFPTLHPLAHDFWDKFWKIYSAPIARAPERPTTL